MRSRFAVLLMLVAGLLFSTTGAGLAVTGLAGSDQASVAQYGENEQGQGGNQVLGESEESPVPAEQVQPARQTQFSSSANGSGGTGGQLPFTGFAAIPVLVLGVALLGGGLALRRTGSA